MREIFGPRTKPINGYTKLWEDDISQKDYERNKKELGPDWYYYDKKITFKYNSNGFRAPEFDTIDWANSVVIFGDSYTAGDGNAIEDIATTLLQDILKMPVINLGASGTGIDYSCWNSLLLHESYPRPRAIVQLWSSIHRYGEFSRNPSVRDGNGSSYTHHLPGDPRPIFGRSQYCARDHNWLERNKMYVLADRVLWKDKLPYYEASVFDVTAEELEVDFLIHRDYGRDLDHWGPKSNIEAANIIAKNLKKQGV